MIQQSVVGGDNEQCSVKVDNLMEEDDQAGDKSIVASFDLQ